MLLREEKIKWNGRIQAEGSGQRVSWAAIERARDLWLRRALAQGLGREDAEDLFQDAILAALEGIERLRIGEDQDLEDAFLAWFWGILRHKQVSHHRRRKRLRRILSERGSGDRPASIARAADSVRLSLGLFERSRPEAAGVLRRRFLEGCQLSQLADDLGVSVPTACRRVQSALDEIRECAERVDL
jgi:RNA polymerase sigma factor (sigma-70 family)